MKPDDRFVRVEWLDNRISYVRENLAPYVIRQSAGKRSDELTFRCSYWPPHRSRRETTAYTAVSSVSRTVRARSRAL
jgi:hypothetical protein